MWYNISMRETKLIQAAYWLGYMKSSLDNEDINNFIFGQGMFTNYYKVINNFPKELFAEYKDLVNEFNNIKESV